VVHGDRSVGTHRRDGITFSGWPEFGIAVSFWRGCPRSDAI
jgi:hypothetical protein